MKTRANLPLPAALLAVTAATLLTASCASMMKEPQVEVKAAFNPHAPLREKKTYALVCESELVQRWFLSNPKAVVELGAALEKQGYEEAQDPATATHVIKVALGFAPREQRLQREENPNSIRYQNVAAMIGQGRYNQILTESNDPRGSLLVGPNGQVIPTGGWKRLIEDSERPEFNDIAVKDFLILSAWDVSEPEKKARIFAWQVVVQRAVDFHPPSPEHVGILVRAAASRLDPAWSDAPPAKAAAPGPAQ